MLPFLVTLLVVWAGFLLGFWALGLPPGPGASYTYPPPVEPGAPAPRRRGSHAA